MIRLLIPSGLERAGQNEFQGSASATLRGADAAEPLEHECDEGDAVELEWGDGTCIIQRADDLASRLDESSPSTIDLALASSRRLTTTRDGAFSSLVKVVVHSQPAKDTLHVVMTKFDEARLRSGQPPDANTKPVAQLWSIDDSGQLRPRATTPPSSGKKRRVLLLVHGAFSNTRESFAALFTSTTWTAVFAQYDDVYGFDHPTVSVDPFTNAELLVTLLPANAAIDVISYSRGGLVGDLLVAACGASDAKPNGAMDEAMAALRADAHEKNLDVRVSIRVGAPVRGTTLMSKRLDTWLNVFLNVLGLTLRGVTGPAIEVYDGLKSLVVEIVRSRSDVEVAPGLAAMMPTGSLARWLPTQRGDDKLIVIAGDASRPDFLGRLRTLLVDLFFQQKNDLVVDTAAMVGGVEREDVTLKAFRDTPDAPLHHLSYFSNREVQLAIASGLIPTADDSPRSPSALRDWHIGLDATFGDGAVAPAPVKPNVETSVIVVPGIMGSMLAANGSVIWPRASAIAKGRFSELLYPNGEVREVLAGPYHRLLDFLAQEFRPVTFPYDWRASIRESAERLADRIEEELNDAKKVHVIAHSLGGLVLLGVRAFRRGTWDKWVAQDNRAIFLGTPFRGSWSIVELLTGRADLIRLLAFADIWHSAKDLLEIIKRFPAVLELLPSDNDSPVAGKYEPPLTPARWSEAWRAVLHLVEAQLDDARKVRAKLDEALGELADAPNLFYVAGRGRSLTLCGGSPEDPLAFSTSEGDGTVTWRAPIGAKLKSYLLEAEHGDLADTPTAFGALSDLLLKGETNALRSLADARARRDMGAPMPTVAATPPPADETPTLVPSDEDLANAGMSRSGAAAARPLRIEVVHGDLAKERDVVVVGHAYGEALRGAEPSLDIVFRGLLSERLRAGRYPGLLGMSVAIPPPPPADPRRQRKDDDRKQPAGVVVIGLGNINDLTRARLKDAFQSALIELSLPPASTAIPDEAARRLSVSLVGYRPYGGLDVTESVSACLDAIVLANRALVARGLASRCIERVRFVDVYAQVAEQVTRVCQSYARNPGIEVVQDEPIVAPRVLERLADWLPLRSVRARPSGRFRRITIESVEEKDHSSIAFGIAGDGALSDRKVTEVSWSTIDRACNELVAQATFPPRQASALRAHVLPLALHEEWTSGRDLQLVVDPRTARIPWELFLSAGIDGAEQLTSSVSVLRQLQTSQTLVPRPSRGDGRALVICAPGAGAPPLRGAAREADDVHALLSRNGFRVEAARAENEIRPAISGRYEIVHIAGHGQFVRNSPRETGAVIRFSPQADILSIFDLRAFEAAPPAVVFLSCCHLGQTDAALRLEEPASFAAGLAADLIRQGVQVVVAAGWAVNDEIARVFANAFYEQLLEGQPLRLALSNARVRAREKDRSLATWAAYQVYGLPDFVLPSVRARASNVDLDIEALLTSSTVVSDQEALDVLGEVLRRLDLGGAVPVGLRTLPERFVQSLPPELQTTALNERLAQIKRAIDGAPTPPPPITATLDVTLQPATLVATATTRRAHAPDVPLHPFQEPALATAADATAAYLTRGTNATAQEVAALWLTALHAGLRPDVQRQARQWLWDRLYELRSKDVDAYRSLIVALQLASEDILDDMNAGMFGFESARNELKLTATVERAHSQGLYAVTLRLERPPHSPPANAMVYLGRGFGPRELVRVAGPVMKKVIAFGSFTVGVEVFEPRGVTRLELDLADAELIGVDREQFIQDGLRR